ncbi:RbsD/FucU family protein [Hespellia stercorisuis]|uniref:L-fucose mutarotase n=1 Tax=Hespellia stercorisuis DSM 15480 TaxID=1121950 RepID=A0A1M6SLW7_9FIRM|nr:RbsD/FucU domain-containing protein [Hespellia stercorisuis]SHK45568.1 L-fucose mutarotase [Hespellia stercorisuis DSM 15480]
MLKGIPTRIGSDLLKALADMGHGDILIIADDFYPPISKTPNGVSIQAKGNTAPEMIEAILQLMPLDADYCEHPVEYMIPDKDAGVEMDRPKVWDDVIAVTEKSGYDAKCVGEIERSKFYEKAGKAYLTVCTSERQPYGCFILQKGVL